MVVVLCGQSMVFRESMRTVRVLGLKLPPGEIQRGGSGEFGRTQTLPPPPASVDDVCETAFPAQISVTKESRRAKAALIFFMGAIYARDQRRNANPLPKRVEAWRGKVSGRQVGAKEFEAGADVVAEEGDVEVGEGGRVGFELAKGGGEEAGGTEEVAAAEVVEGYGGLDEGLEEELFGLGSGEPDTLPGLVRVEEVCGVVEAQAFGEGAVGPVECHRRSLGELAAGRRQKRTTEYTEQKREHGGCIEASEVSGFSARTCGWSEHDI